MRNNLGQSPIFKNKKEPFEQLDKKLKYALKKGNDQSDLRCLQTNICHQET